MSKQFQQRHQLLILMRSILHHQYLAYLRPFKQTELAKAGDSTKHQMLTELTLQVKNEASSAMINGLV